MDPRRLLVLLLPRPLEAFILRDQAQDLLREENVVALEPPRVPYGALGRAPLALSSLVAARQAARLRLPGVPRAILVFHPFQWPLARALQLRHPEAEIWYSRWDRYEHALDASPRDRARLEMLHEAVSQAASVTFAASGALAELSHDAVVTGLAADSFPAPDPERAVIAVSLGHLGHRCDWALLHRLSRAMPELVLLLIGAWHDDELRGDEDYAACRAAPGFVWLGHRDDEEAARLILCASVGIVPFKVEPFNDAGLPYRILKYARLGRPTVAPPLQGVRTWERAVTRAEDLEGWVAALRAARPDPALREWALGITAEAVNAPLRERMRELGIA